MGYTHYWTKQREIFQKEWNEFSKTCKKLHDNLPEYSESAGGYYKDKKITIVDGLGYANTKPLFTNQKVRFNGEGLLSHETFYITFLDEVDNFAFCKTARKPYDLLVVACLIAASLILNYNVRSDGEIEDLLPGFDFYKQVMKVNLHPSVIFGK